MKLKSNKYLMTTLFLGLLSFIPAQNLIIDPGFENTTNENGFITVRVNWQDVINSAYTANDLDTWFTPTVTEVYAGDRSARFYVEVPENGVAIRKVQLITRNWIETNAVAFRASVFAFVDDSGYGEEILNTSSNQQMKILLHVRYEDGSSKYPQETFELSNDYEQYTFETPDLTDPTRGEITSVKLRFQMGESSGTYWLDEATLEEIEPLSINDFEIKPEIKITPNPASDFININTDTELTSVSLYNIVGQQVIKLENSVDKINISHLKSGVYFLKYISESGYEDVVKVIKK